MPKTRLHIQAKNRWVTKHLKGSSGSVAYHAILGLLYEHADANERLDELRARNRADVALAVHRFEQQLDITMVDLCFPPPEDDIPVGED